MLCSCRLVYIVLLLLGTWQGKVPVAVKQLRDDRMDNAGGYEKAREEFLKEARIFKLVNHPNLVQVNFSGFVVNIIITSSNYFILLQNVLLFYFIFI